MYSIVRLSIFLKILGVIHLSHVKSNSISKLERNNVLNKALWVKRNAEKNPGLSVFRLNSFDVDDIHDNNNNFKGENEQQTMFFSSFNERNKRDTLDVLKENKRDISTVKPLNIVDDSYKEAGLLPQTDHYNIIHNIPPHPYTFVIQPKLKYVANMSEQFKKIMKPLSDKAQNLSKPIANKYNLSEEPNYESTKTVLDKNKLPWLHNGVMPSNKTSYSAKSEEKSTNTPTLNKISERELFKVVGMLTKTFKRIIKQHNDIRLIHSRLQNINNNFMRNSKQLIEKFQHFDNEYNHVIKINEKLNERLKSIKDQQVNLKNKEEILAKHVLELEKQRKQFLVQQNLFFNIQKQILAQNEKITYKQAQIANRQTILSHRQSNIAKVLKEAHQMSTTTEKVPNENQNDNNYSRPSAANSVKIDLFSVKPDAELSSLDQDILKDKDAESIDDLIYKFYFNNTFIDDFINNQLLANIVNRPDTREMKTRKRERPESTVLMPVPVAGKLRQRRWIKYTKKKSHKNETTTVMSIKAKMNAKSRKNENSDPFIKMAMTFCTELGQTSNVQSFNWCVEKTLRRLKVIDSKNTASPKPSTILTTTTTTAVPASSTQTPTTKEDSEASILAKYFPDNDELEEKLKDFDLKADTEGNVYYDRSLHISDIDPKDVDDGGVSDILPGYESHSKMDFNPILRLQALKRGGARRLTGKIKRIKMVKK